MLHGEALLALPVERWLSATPTDPEYLRRPDALRAVVEAARAMR